MTTEGGFDNTLQGDFGETWLEVTASAFGLDHGRPASTDLDKVDVQVTRRGLHWGTYSPSVKVQVKTVMNLHRLVSGDLSYQLDIKTYDVLRRRDHSIRRVLIVVSLRDDGRRIHVSEEGTTLLGQAYWMSLEGLPPSRNSDSVVVHIPIRNLLDEEGLMRMLKECGIRTSTIVPDFDPWEAGR